MYPQEAAAKRFAISDQRSMTIIMSHYTRSFFSAVTRKVSPSMIVVWLIKENANGFAHIFSFAIIMRQPAFKAASAFSDLTESLEMDDLDFWNHHAEFYHAVPSA